MSNLLDKICALRDLIAERNYKKLKYCQMEILQLKEEIHRQMSKKSLDYKHEIDFTSQDLRELAEDIRGMLDEWSDIMNPVENIKSIDIDNKGVVNINPFMDKVVPIMTIRTLSIQALTEFLSLVEYHAVFLYFVELASQDKFALEYTERVI